MTLKYSQGGAWSNIPDTALAGTYAGTYHVAYPEPVDHTYDGEPCAAVGKPSIVIQMALLTDTGMGFWQGLFASTTELATPLYLEALDARASTVTRWYGQLLRPIWGSVGVGATASQTVYRNVEIRIVQCEASA